MLRVSENCPWNRCTFCEMYKGHRFVYRPVEEIKADIDRAAAIRDAVSTVAATGEAALLNRAKLAVYLTLASPEFIVQR